MTAQSGYVHNVRMYTRKIRTSLEHSLQMISCFITDETATGAILREKEHKPHKGYDGLVTEFPSTEQQNSAAIKFNLSRSHILQ